jgi:hypothetical protein
MSHKQVVPRRTRSQAWSNKSDKVKKCRHESGLSLLLCFGSCSARLSHLTAFLQTSNDSLKVAHFPSSYHLHPLFLLPSQIDHCEACWYSMSNQLSSPVIIRR